jgi:hypothetical protein
MKSGIARECLVLGSHAPSKLLNGSDPSSSISVCTPRVEFESESEEKPEEKEVRGAALATSTKPSGAWHAAHPPVAQWKPERRGRGGDMRGVGVEGAMGDGCVGVRSGSCEMGCWGVNRFFAALLILWRMCGFCLREAEAEAGDEVS